MKPRKPTRPAPSPFKTIPSAMHATRLTEKLAFLAALALTAAHAGEFTVPATLVTGSHGGNYNGTLVKMIDGSGMTRPDPSNPTTWTIAWQNYYDEWQATSLLSTGTSENAKIGWAIIDLGSSTANLSKLYLWNVRDSARTAGTKT